MLRISMLSLVLLAGCAPQIPDYDARNREAQVATARFAAEQVVKAEQTERDWTAWQVRYEHQAAVWAAEHRRTEAIRLSAYPPSDVAACRAQGNMVYGDIEQKRSVMDDCLEARRLR